MKFFELFSKKKQHSPFSESIFNLIGFYPNDETLYKKAFVHRSVSRHKNDSFNNERLEFLGDSVIDLIIAEWLMKNFSHLQEGTLTQLRAKIVNRKNLNRCAEVIGLNSLIKTDGKITLSNTSIPGNCLEALIGAVYLDTNMITATNIVNKLIITHIDEQSLIAKTTNFKSKLLEWSQQEKNQLEFVMLESQIENQKQFEAEILVNDKSVAKAVGKNKKEASQLASKIALDELDIS